MPAVNLLAKLTLWNTIKEGAQAFFESYRDYFTEVSDRLERYKTTYRRYDVTENPIEAAFHTIKDIGLKEAYYDTNYLIHRLNVRMKVEEDPHIVYGERADEFYELQKKYVMNYGPLGLIGLSMDVLDWFDWYRDRVPKTHIPLNVKIGDFDLSEYDIIDIDWDDVIFSGVSTFFMGNTKHLATYRGISTEVWKMFLETLGDRFYPGNTSSYVYNASIKAARELDEIIERENALGQTRGAQRRNPGPGFVAP